MPSAGLQIAGIGLNLQAQTPGNADIGNAHITGTLITDRFMQPYGGIPAASSSTILGEGFSTAYLNGFKTSCIAIAPAVGATQLGPGGLPNSPITFAILIGKDAVVENDNAVAIGTAAQAACGATVFTASNVALGSGARAYSLNRTRNCSSVAIGSSAVATGDNFSIAIGTANAKSLDAMSIGNCGDPVQNNCPNSITIDTLPTTLGSPNSVTIGNASHTVVKIGSVVVIQPFVRTILSTADNTVTNTIVETLATTTAGAGINRSPFQFGLPATLGTSQRISMKGRLSTDAVAPTLMLRFKTDLGTVVAASAAVLLPAGLTNVVWECDLLMHVRAIGAGGTWRAFGLFKYADATGIMRTIQIDQAAPVVVNCTIDQQTNIYATWGTASVNNILTTGVCTFEASR